MTKEILRKEILGRRKRLGKDEILAKSAVICANIMPYLTGTVGMYAAYGQEVDLHNALQSYDSVIVLPRTYPDHTLRFFQVDKDTSFEKSSLGIQEPREGREVMPTDIAVLLLPLVAFDESCHRLGHGGGFYDRYLKDFQGLRIGIAYECQKCEHIPCDVHDEALHMVITEEKIYHRAKES